jgi:hypothetical protein
MSGPGWGGRQPAPNLDPGLRETTVNSVTRWKRRLDIHGRTGPDPLRQELALTGREAGQLRTLALARGAATLAQLLERVESLAAGPASAVADAVQRISEHIGLDEPRGVLEGRTDEAGQGNMPKAAPRIEPVRPSPSATAPRAGASSEAPAAALPPLLGRSVLAGSMLEPPMLDALQPQPGPVPTPGTMHSAQARSGDVAAGVGGPIPKAVDPAPRPSRAPPAVRLPDSIRALSPPKLLGTLMGLRAFGKRSAEAQQPKPAGGQPAAVLGLRARTSQRPKVAAWAPPERPHLADARRDGSRSPDWPSTPRPRKWNRGARATEPAAPRWFVFVAAAIALLAVVTVSVVLLGGHRSPVGIEPIPHPGPTAASGSVLRTRPSNPSSSSVPDNPLTHLVHQRGNETPELRALLDAQGRMALACKNDPASCGRGWTPIARDAFNPIDRASLTLTPVPETPLSAWLQRLKLPRDFPIHDDPTLRALFDFNTKNIAGRQRFQAKLFECAAYDDIFDSTLVKYGAPPWLTAVVYQESGCDPRATSDVGARGLWQFMPESARAYGLRVVDGEIDERLNPMKSTDAAIHFLTDLQRTLGAWDLVLAAYNMGPFAVLARLAQAGESAGFWDLSHAGLLPDETAGYVPAIEAYALALQNLHRLQFSRDGKRLESTAEIVVKPGLRLSLIARAASTTTIHIRELNPEFLRDVVPEGETTLRVPDAESHRAQAFVESWSPDDNRDTCVPEDFDWGARQFDTSKFAKNCPQTAATP